MNQAAEVIANGEEKRTVAEALNQYVLLSLAQAEQSNQRHARLCISPQCGFASHSEGNNIAAEDVKRKLSLVARAAKEIWSDA